VKILTTHLKISFVRLLGGSTFALALALTLPTGHALAATGCGSAYTVRQGDVLWRLAMEHHTDIWTLARMNHIPDPNLIYIGQCMTFPDQVQSPSPSATSAASAYAGASGAQAPASTGGGSVSGILAQAASDHGVPAALVMAIAWQESNWNQSARGGSGEIGLMQILPATGDMLNAGHGTSYDIWTAQGNAELGAMFLSDLLRTEHGCLTCAISAYNEGPGNFATHGYLNWQSYVAPVLALMQRY
jgi:hypothetical protein